MVTQYALSQLNVITICTGDMYMRLQALVVAAAPLAMLAASPASAAGFVNGSFESSTCGASAGGFATVSAGSNCITGWTVDSGSVDYINGYWQAQSGVASIDLAGNSPGAISQIFDTIAGQIYSVDYYLSGNPDGGSLAKFGIVSAVNGSLISSATFLGLQGASHWQHELHAMEFYLRGNRTYDET